MDAQSYDRWNATTDDELTAEKVDELLSDVEDDLWVAAACADRLHNDPSVQRVILAKGISRTAGAMRRVKAASRRTIPAAEDGATQNEAEGDKVHLDERDARLLAFRALFQRRMDRVNTYVEMAAQTPSTKEGVSSEPVAAAANDDPWDEGDPWDDDGASGSSGAHAPPTLSTFPFPLRAFLDEDILQFALQLASLVHFGALRILMLRHSTELQPYRFAILEAIPEHAHPSESSNLLPIYDFSLQCETLRKGEPWRDVPDWSESDEARAILRANHVPEVDTPQTHLALSRLDTPLSADDLAVWYRNRAQQIEQSAGLVDVALAYVQHGASQGLPRLDEFGEELSLLARLVYDATGTELDESEDWSMERWQAMDISTIVDAYLKRSTSETIVGDIKRLVMPYLYVLEARCERAGSPDPGLLTRFLYEYILSAPLTLVASIFDASKPTLSLAHRLIQKDEDIARLALACLYGSNSLDQWATMSQIFECLPAWDGVATGDDGAETQTTLISLTNFVTPTTAQTECTPSDLFIFFTPLPAVALSRALDVLDVHLESGEILARWGVPAPLRWFIRGAQDYEQQRAWATRMARRAANNGRNLGDEKEWSSLLTDMLKLASGGQGGIKAAFGLLSKDEVIRIFFSGILSSGQFETAKFLLRTSPVVRSLKPDVIEGLCLTASREFYDNASSGNLHHGEMKLAYECLSVAPSTPKIRKEREFIEATSRICSFNVMSRPGVPILPLEIRMVEDRLSLVARVLSSNEDAYKHTEVILDLVAKLGFKGDIAAEIKAFAMLADSAIQAENFTKAAEICLRMVHKVADLKPSNGGARPAAGVLTSSQEAVEVSWQKCFQLGRQSEYSDVRKKMILLGHALEMCPRENTLDVLAVWRRLEGEYVESQKRGGGMIPDHRDHRGGRSRRRTLGSPALRSHPSSDHLSPATLVGPETAAMAARTLNRVAANFPFSVGSRAQYRNGNNADPPGSTRSAGLDVSSHAKHAFARGVGWLIGVDDEESGHAQS
ncbi:hypothetical protein BOTBODRAFT_161149 [Botryobasidium botryosum FD-172 SS1]|uniref:Sec39 domain-containing protein n=1 Tax=Botryobasidium botryosum (strain FD-172 SS1) TaxID=930990 RepID=A0A067ME14_BOTB1|nr:hypothetical protein BOTBODRAFT_161149 [Botryobasidium botryosum FD-172 SS1]